MSNQVYSNNNRKYYACPGSNVFVMQADVILGGATGDAPNTIPFAGGIGSFNFHEANSIIDGPGICIINPSDLDILEDGMYNVKLFVEFEDNVDPTTNDTDLLVYMTLTRNGSGLNGVVLDSNVSRRVAPGNTTVGSITRNLSVSFTGFLKAGDQINLFSSNFSVNSVILLNSGCQLFVNKIY